MGRTHLFDLWWGTGTGIAALRDLAKSEVRSVLKDDPDLLASLLVNAPDGPNLMEHLIHEAAENWIRHNPPMLAASSLSGFTSLMISDDIRARSRFRFRLLVEDFGDGQSEPTLIGLDNAS